MLLSLVPLLPPLSYTCTYCTGCTSTSPLYAHPHTVCPCRTGVIPASEFADRFYSIFSSTPGSIRHELFLQMALLVPQPAKRLELLQHAANVSHAWGGIVFMGGWGAVCAVLFVCLLCRVGCIVHSSLCMAHAATTAANCVRVHSDMCA